MMKTINSILTVSAFAGLLLILTSADHIDAPAVSGQFTDIADFYSFESPSNTDNLVFATTVQGLLSPGATGSASFAENVMIEINIDNDGDLVEDMVIQAIPKNGRMHVFGPYAPSETGLSSTVDETQDKVIVDITEYGVNAISNTANGVTAFAGPRDDPFFFDLGAYQNVLAGTASGFSNPGNDSFAGTNVLAVVVEVPKSSLNSTGMLNTWVETKQKQ